MKIKRMTALMIFLTFFLTSCGESNKWDTKINKGDEWTSFQGYWVLPGQISASELGYYYSEPGFNTGYKLCFFDKKTQQSSVVCNRPNCKHRDANCPAIFSNVYEMQYNNGYLFYVERDELMNGYLCRCAADGTKRERLFLVAPFGEIFLALPYLHKNHLFLVETHSNGADMTLCYVNMNDSKNQNEVQEKILIAQGQNPHITVEDISDTSILYSISDKDWFNIKCYEYNYHTQETNEISLQGKAIGYIRYVKENIMYTCDKGTNLYLSDSKTEIMINPHRYDQISYDGKYIYIDNLMYFEEINEEHRIDVYDADGTLIDTIPITGTAAENVLEPYFGDQDYLFMQSEKKDHLYIFDKKQIGTNTKEWLVR